MKVGKAIYNILSQSTDVQSNFPFNTTDYSPTGTELVTNGDFSATGTELITNGDFATDGTPTTTSWSLGWAIVGVDGGGANITGGELVLDSPDGADSNYNRVYATNGSSAITGVVEVGKSYKLTYTVTAVTGSPTFKYINGGAYADAPTSLETHVIYYVCTTTANFGFRNSGNDSSITLDNVSVKELGEDWTLGTGWSIGEDKSIFSGTAFATLSPTSPIIEEEKSYKITFDATVTNGSFKLQNSSTDILISSEGGSFVEYFTAGSTSLTFARAGVGIQNDFTITNISVEEMVLTKIFPELAPPDIDAPYIVYSVVSNSPSETKNANGDIDTASIEVYGFQDTYNKAVDLGVSIRAALDRKTGTYNTIEIQSTNYVNEQMDVNEARKLWAAIQDYSIRIKNI